MCGRFTLRATPTQIAEYFELTRSPEVDPRPNIAPTQPVLAIVPNETGERLATQFQWGLVPSWSKDPRGGAKMINARSETAAEKPAFRSAFRHRRCLIPADGFYEWKAIPGQKKKQPVLIGLQAMPLMAFAGLWETWSGGDGSELASCTILTTQANAALSPIHDRMPVILSRDDYSTWLDATTDADQLRSLLRPFPAKEMVLSESAATELLNLRPSRQQKLFESPQ